MPVTGGRVPAGRRPEITEMFGGEAGFALARYPSWFSALSARLGAVLEDLLPVLA